MSKLPIFTPDRLQRLAPFKEVERTASRIESLKERPLRNFAAIRRANEDLEVKEGRLAIVQGLLTANEEWHRKNPTVPSWAHAADEGANALYSDLRELDIVAEKTTVSPGYERAKQALHYSQLDDAERAILINYFHSHKPHDGDDHLSPGDAYWPTQRLLDRVASKLPPMSSPVTVWRGEILTTNRFATSGTKQNNVDRINRLMNLNPGDSLTWDSCVATSLQMRLAAKYDFCFPRHPEDFQRSVTWDGSNDVEHSVLFEMETDRGVFIDRGLASAAPVNEDEILLPQHMEFTVLGHWQMDAERADREANKAIHVIKLKLKSQGT
ncbi:hypothetical protein [Pseudarthrobacter sp. BIM B-2242]|uniref:hypothetical protein n=1 Tax=Pseudarthrobacter sp. BIM B-2242 TaxID=2772401 RepID=UPI00168BFEF6|nr:hypothetical protein [Pseudarthrobacter sp. BIM B-2242]QOD06105.1 hypothetical protein IDT60_21330 [Pseudarthrobacter sp. BIM B-2242]